MTLGTIFSSVLGPSSSPITHQAIANLPQKFLSERNSGFYHHGSSKHHKGKSKSDKKHAILSALTLLAFLFFLSILQSCIREQNTNRGTMMLFTPTGGTAPTGHQGKDPGRIVELPESGGRRKRSAEWVPRNRTGYSRKSRVLLSVVEPSEEARRRQVKFIRNFSAGNNWTKELSQMSEGELEDQKLKMLNFSLYSKNNRLRAKPPSKAIDYLLRNKTLPQMLWRFRKRGRTPSSNEPIQMENEEPTWNYKRPYNFHPSPRIPERPRNDSYPDYTQSPAVQTRREATIMAQLTLNKPTTMDPVSTQATIDSSTTPRSRRSDHSTLRPSDYEYYDRYTDLTRNDGHTSPTSAIGLDLNTFQTFPVHNYYNHRPAPLRDNVTNDLSTSDSASSDVDRIHNEVLPLSTQQPLFHPTKTTPNPHSYIKPRPTHFKDKDRHSSHHSPHQLIQYHLRNHHQADTRYRFSPYRKNGLYDPSHFHDHFHDDYYTPVVLAKYEVQHDEPGFDLMKFLWTMLTSFAKPLTKLVPAFAKDGGDEPQCYDLLVCEAQRASRFIGPTAEALATTFGTLLTWAATDDTRQTVVDAINSGRENTCQQQIRDCEERSGGKSAMTVIAQVMEMKLR